MKLVVMVCCIVLPKGFFVDRAERVRKIELLCGRLLAMEQQEDHLKAVVGYDSESPFGKELLKLKDLLIEQVAELIGDTCDWLWWYVLDNEYGKKGLEVRNNINEFRMCIKTPSDLVAVLEYSEKGHEVRT